MIYVEPARSLERQQNGQMRVCPRPPRLKTIKWGGFEQAMTINLVNSLRDEIDKRSEEQCSLQYIASKV